jgi:SP family sugar:H+ symporter-like MFS transporter
VLYLGRIILGISNGLFMTFTQLYIQEVSPPHLRGVGIGVFQIFISTGTLIGATVDNFTSKISGKPSYQIPLAVMFAVPVMILVGAFFIPESPRWLVGMGRNEEAKRSLIRLRGTVSDEIAIVKELGEMQKAREDQLASSNSRTIIMELFNKQNRRRTILSVLTVQCQAASGSMWLISTSTIHLI